MHVNAAIKLFDPVIYSILDYVYILALFMYVIFRRSSREQFPSNQQIICILMHFDAYASSKNLESYIRNEATSGYGFHSWWRLYQWQPNGISR